MPKLFSRINNSLRKIIHATFVFVAVPIVLWLIDKYIASSCMTNRATVNRVILLGRITTEPYVYVEHGQKMLRFTLTTVENIKRGNGIVEPHTEKHSVHIPAYLAGDTQPVINSLVYLQGRVRTRQYTDEQQIKRYETDIVASALDLIETEVLKYSPL